MFFFFFQAEDGIRDYKVTGVQTCALPIYARDARPACLGAISIYQNVVVPEPPVALSAQSIDRVRQTGVGINDVERWKDRAALSVGILMTNYTRTVAIPGLPANVQHKSVPLPTVSFSVNPLRTATL